MRFSLRHLFCLLFAFGLVAASFRYAGEACWVVLSTVALVIYMGYAIIAFVGKGPEQSFAIGFAVCVLIYGMTLAVSGDELFLDSGSLLTTRVLSFAYLSTLSAPTNADMYGRPTADFVMGIGHVWWSLLVGWIGGSFAMWIRSRRGECASSW